MFYLCHVMLSIFGEFPVILFVQFVWVQMAQIFVAVSTISAEVNLTNHYYTRTRVQRKAEHNFFIMICSIFSYLLSNFILIHNSSLNLSLFSITCINKKYLLSNPSIAYDQKTLRSMFNFGYFLRVKYAPRLLRCRLL